MTNRPSPPTDSQMRVVVVDDHAPIRKSLRQMIELKGPYIVVGEGSNGAEAVERVEELAPDLVLMDMNMPIMSGAEATRVIKERHPEIKVLALTAFADMSLVSAMVKAGASGYLLKGGSPDELLESLHAVARGHAALDKEVTRGVMNDMAELYRKEQERAEALAELDRMKSEFVAVISHELRTPVTTIKGGAITLQKRWDKVDAETRDDLLDSVVRQCDRLTHMIGRILTVSGIQTEGISVDRTEFSLDDIARAALRRVEEKASGRNIRVSAEEVRTSGNRELAIDVASALIENALDFTSGSVEIVVGADGNESRLEIRDEGPGMTEETLSRLLNEPFSQADASSTRRVGGLGLSLYMAQQVLSAWGGRLEVDSGPDRGSTFVMVLPVA
ncbi:MAG: response regulator [Actinomycetota bacterium]|nr:response regulator [Actinomycetota bacterium]